MTSFLHLSFILESKSFSEFCVGKHILIKDRGRRVNSLKKYQINCILAPVYKIYKLLVKKDLQTFSGQSFKIFSIIYYACKHFICISIQCTAEIKLVHYKALFDTAPPNKKNLPHFHILISEMLQTKNGYNSPCGFQKEVKHVNLLTHDARRTTQG